jgi:pyruvate dehydrogenase E1 component alpha subunit
MRMHGHAAHDDMRYVPPQQLQYWRARDPIDRFQAQLRVLGVDVEAICADVARELDGALEQALAQPMPEPESATAGVFCEDQAQPLGDGVAPYSGFHSGAVGNG